MGTTEATGLSGKKPPSLPPALFLLRARSRATRVVDLDDAAALSGQDTPPRRSPVTVPFLWEEVPGKPKEPRSDTAAGANPATTESPVPEHGATAAAATTATPGPGDHGNKGDAKARPVPLKLPPRLQAADSSLSPKTVLHSPYGCTGGAKRPPKALRRTGSVATFWRTPSAGVGLFSRSKTGTSTRGGHDSDAAAPDAPWCSPAASSASSSSSSSLSTCFGDDHGHGAHPRPADGREDYSEEDEGAKGFVRITRFRRNRSLPSMTASHLWASIRKSVKQITPWS